MAADQQGRVVGRVIECNTPTHCVTAHFKVSVLNAGWRTVARTSTSGVHNDYRLRLAAGNYQLVAQSSGLKCYASTTAVAHQTTRQDITCLVP